ncbi:hypothetical protein ACWCQL_13850 [Streptomyces sp. NPDC002073]
MAYTHTSVVNWTRRGMAPKAPMPSFIAYALGERLGRPVDIAEIGMHQVRENTHSLGLDFPFTDPRSVRIGSELR